MHCLVKNVTDGSRFRIGFHNVQRVQLCSHGVGFDPFQRTIAELAGEPLISDEAVAETDQFRKFSQVFEED